MKPVLDKIQTIPNTVSSAIVQQLLAAREVFFCLSFSTLHIAKQTKSITLMFCSLCIPGGRIYPGQKCLPPASLLCRHRNQKTISRRTVIALGKCGVLVCKCVACAIMSSVSNKYFSFIPDLIRPCFFSLFFSPSFGVYF